MTFIRSVCLFFLIFFIPSSFSEGSSPRILLLNSDYSVEKYRVAQDEFTQVIGQPVKKIDLGAKKWKAADIEDLLYDEYPDLVYCIGTKAYLVANKYISERNIVFSSVVNWLRLPVAKKTYGVSNELHAAMQITLFRYIFPKIHRIGVLYSRQYTRQWFEEARDEAREMKVEIIGQAVSGPKQTLPALKELLPKVDAFWLISDPVIMGEKGNPFEILKECEVGKIPVFSYHELFAKYGATLIVSVDDPTIGRQAADIAEEVLFGGRIEQKVQFPAGSHITLNLKKIKEYGLQYNENALGLINKFAE